ncbi:MAG: RND transporter [Flavobacteriales bacterium]|nr:RND transporter [Flavobacteriales bacterium]
MKSFIKYFIKYPVAANVIMLLIIVFGCMGLFNLRKTFFPERTSKIITIQTVNPGASPLEMEQMVTLKIEDNIDGITGVKRVTSKSTENTSNVIVEIENNADNQVVLQDIKNSVDRINSFPANMESPSINLMENLNPAISFAISGDVSLLQLKNTSEKIEDDLKEMNGISKVSLSGFVNREIEISVRDNDVKKYNITLNEINNAIKSENIDITAGKIKTSSENFQIRSNNKRYSSLEIAEIVIKNDNNKIVRIKDVADVKIIWQDIPNKKFFNDTSCVVIKVFNTNSEDISIVASLTREYIDSFNMMSPDVKASIIQDDSVIIEQRISLLTKNGIIGFILVMIILTLFLHPSLAGWVAVAIPISFAGMFILASFYGITLNVISLFGMIIVIGILVDDGIVIAENIYQRFEKGEGPFKAAINGTLEVLPAVTSAILTTIVAFSLFFMLDGMLGDFFPEMGFVVIGTLLFSLIEGIIILPSHIAHSRALKGQKPNKYVEVTINKTTLFLDNLKNKYYLPFLKYSIKNPVTVILVFISSLVITISALSAGLIKSTVFPNIEGDNILINLKFQAGSSEEKTKKWVNIIEKKIIDKNKEISSKYNKGISLIKDIEKTIGNIQAADQWTPSTSQSTEKGSLNIIIVPSEERSIGTSEIANYFKEAVGEIPTSESLTFDIASPFGKAISIALFSDDNDELFDAINILKQYMQNLNVLKNIVSSDQKGLKEIKLTLKSKAYQLNLSSLEILSKIRSSFYGFESQRLQLGTDEVKLWIRYDNRDRNSIYDLENMRIIHLDKSYRLGDLVNLNIERDLISIDHLNGKRSVQIDADLLNPKIDNPISITGNIEEFIFSEIKTVYPSIKHSVEGQIRSQQETGGSVKKSGPIVLILMLTIILFTFRSILQTFAVFTLIPFGFIGVGWGHFIHDFQLSMFSWFGMIALIGILVNDALVFISKFNKNLKSGVKFEDALIETGSSRFRPIILTSLTTIVGLAPLIFEKELQAQFLIPMAIAIAYGLVLATFLTLIFLPAQLKIINKIRFYREWIFTGNKLNNEQREPAVKEIKYETI